METHELVEIPNWQLIKMTCAGGVRHPKFEKFKPVWGFERKPWEFGKPLHVMGCHSQGQVTSHSDWLSNGDFRYWGSSPACRYSGQNIAYCRICGETCWTKEGRKEHRKKGCGAIMEKVAKSLRRGEKLCLLCRIPTRRTCFGFYLCSAECTDTFKFYKLQPQRLLEEIGEVRNAKT